MRSINNIHSFAITFLLIKHANGFQRSPIIGSSSLVKNVMMTVSDMPSFAGVNTTMNDSQSYATLRGDGSTGGGGVAMPRSKRPHTDVGSPMELFDISSNSEEKQDGLLRRPKVGAEMPKGRPSWFRVPAPSQAENSRFQDVQSSLRSLDLHTVCEEAQCPNIGRF
jgi:hypothetical protein